MDAIANDVLHEIGAMIVQDEKYAGRQWEAMSLVAIVTPTSVDMTGFSYDANGKSSPGTPRNGDIMDKLQNFQQVTQIEGQGPWKTVLIQISKPEMNVAVSFEYEDANKWKVTPANMAVMKEELRPQ
ncbi:hypothetical protein [Parasphingorhabdus cellanae]|uniref:DUF600 family protein n=1 Tax=Parasphingorhabdus cellanae TaxID=2806553 RepID=A0ABX7T4R3_9SPHN|nr:hypothetical protein [Parasphingorhabdus cellanae]QTD56126.1 hypothetical protein J4G78_00500 [Parasphingorhabdus cellanae]